MNHTKIEWTDTTWNPLRGCSRISEGCRNCYAETTAHRYNGPGLPYEGLTVLGNDGRPRWTGEVRMIWEHLNDPLKWKTPRMIFVNSMSDLFHENVDKELIDRVLWVAKQCPQHIFQVLTKRPERMKKHMDHFVQYDGVLSNLWLGVSVENQDTANERIPILLDTPAAVRWISAEPLLGLIDLTNISANGEQWDALDRREASDADLEGGCNGALDWVVVGGESGANARPMDPAWVRSLRDQCVAADVPFFFKQWGGRRKKAAGRTFDGITWDEYPKKGNNQ